MWFSSERNDQTCWYMKVRVVEGRGMTLGRTTVDPYLKLRLSETSSQETVSTKWLRKVTNPQWDQTFRMMSKVFDPNRENLIIKAKDHDRFTRDDDIGEASVPLFMLHLSRGEWKRVVIPLCGNTRGEVVLEIFAENFDTSLPMTKMIPENPLRRKEINDVQWRIGDMVLFSGSTTFSTIIRKVTHAPVTHCALVCGYSESTNEPLIIESNGKHQIVRIVPLSLILRDRVGNPMWVCHLSEKQRNKFRKEEFVSWSWKQDGKKYDLWGTAGAAWTMFQGEEDLSALFCSEIVAAGYRAAGLIEQVNASSVTPIDCVRWNLYEPYYYQTVGDKDILLPGYNTIDPEGWGLIE